MRGFNIIPDPNKFRLRSEAFISPVSGRYGLLYNWYAAIDPRNIMADGWHTPSIIEWQLLVAYLGGEEVAGGKLKEIGEIYWDTPNIDATNEVVFNAIGAGNRYIDTYLDNGFSSRGIYGDFQSSDEVEGAGVSVWLENESGILHTGYFNKICGMSIRPVKDSTSLTHGQTGTYIDPSGIVYRTICIGTQEWVADNIMTRHYRDGSPIPEVIDNAAWMALTTGALCAYNNDWNNV